MATNKIFDDIFAADHSERAVAFKNNIKSAIASFNANPSNAAHIRYLNSQYWDMVYFIVKKKILSTGELSFNDNEKLAIDFGYISDELLGDDKDVTPEMLKESVSVKDDADSCVEYYSISGWLCAQLLDFLGMNKLKEYEKKYEELVNNLNKLREEKQVVIESKKKLDEDFKNNRPAALPIAAVEKLSSFTALIDESLEKYGSIRSRIQNELLLKKDERVEFVMLENQITRTREERKKFYKTLPAVKSDYLSNLVFLEDMIIQKEHEIFDVVTAIGKSRQKIEEFIYSKKEILDDEKDDFLKERISALKNIIDIMSKTNKMDPVIFLTEKPQKNIPDKLFSVIERVIKLDPGFFDNKKVKHYGKPSIILVPGRGRGDYDYNLNAFIIPHFPVNDHVDSMLNAMAIYRWECDDDNKLKNSFSFLKSNKYFTTASTLMQSFIKSYGLYMSKNIYGVGAVKIGEFDYETRGWFAGYISRLGTVEPAEETKGPDEYTAGPSEASAKTPSVEQDFQLVAEKTDDADKPPKETAAAEAEKLPVVEVKPAEELRTNPQKGVAARPERKTPVRLPGEFLPEPPTEEFSGKSSEGSPAKKEDGPSKPLQSRAASDGPRKPLRLPGEFDDDADKTADGTVVQTTRAGGEETSISAAAGDVNETISLLLKENSAIIKKRIQSIFKIDEVRVEPGKDHQRVNVTLLNLDANQVKHFLNLMSLQGKYHKFMASIIKDEEF